ncbi:sensor histidine kinase [Prevotella sp. 10(H)]|uniref:sensor histidine kinase n=1 Tax=Prevotella sp. 10(H) TaxID=1158294 RepID=UPI001E3A836F|nr:histidine kinase [Prevotella sp. 10(H)]
MSIFFIKPDEMIITSDRVYGWAGQFLSFNLVIYFNMYVLVPRLLLKNKLLIYLIAALLLVWVTIAEIVILQNYFWGSDDGNQIENPNSSALLGIISSTITIGLMLAGTTTVLLFKHWMNNSRRISMLESATLESELKFLKSQINPHFLFNMLNNANIMVKEDPEISSQILVKLEDMLRYQINDSIQDKVLLSADIHFLTKFLDLEKTRRDKFDFSIKQKEDMDNLEIPPLLFIPFVENAVKHNSDSENTSYVHICFLVKDKQLIFECENSKPKKPSQRKVGGLGLANIRRRLDLLYGNNYSLEIKDAETTYTVSLQLTL